MKSTIDNNLHKVIIFHIYLIQEYRNHFRNTKSLLFTNQTGPVYCQVSITKSQTTQIYRPFILNYIKDCTIQTGHPQ